MADDTVLDAGSGGDTIRTHEKGTSKIPISLIDVGGSGTTESVIGDAGIFLPVEGGAAEDAAVSGNPLLVGGRFDSVARTLDTGDAGAIALAADGAVHIDDGGNVITVDWAGTAPPIGAGTEATALLVTIATDSTGLLSIDDNGGSLTVDNAALSVTGGGVESGALRVTIANDSTGLVSIDDGGGDISVDWAGTAPPIGAGTEAAALRVTLATDSTGLVSVDDGGANLSVDWAGTVPPIGAGTEAAALRVTIATDSTGVVSIDDGGGSLTVDGTITETNSAAILTAVQLIDNAISGTEMQVDVLTLPARVATTDNIGAAHQTNQLMDGTTSLTPKFALANIAASTTDGAVVAAVGGKKIRVITYKIMAGGTATDVTFTSKPGGAGSAISMLHACAANGGLSSGEAVLGHFETTSGEGLSMTTGAGSTVGVQVTYVEV